VQLFFTEKLRSHTFSGIHLQEKCSGGVGFPVWLILRQPGAGQ
jgi:hypothetical protein